MLDIFNRDQALYNFMTVDGLEEPLLQAQKKNDPPFFGPPRSKYLNPQSI